MMKPFVFIGPTLSVDQALEHLDAIYLPPVKYGDVYRITELYKPNTICIIDGYFNQVPAVWHKEILWAIDQGIRVYGSSSMGALRAAELAPMGMIGHGKIFEAYQQGVLLPYVDERFEDDDEVAVIHGPAEMAYRALSEAMVNIRFTLAKAHKTQQIDQDIRDRLIHIAKTQFYPKRQYQTILERAQKEDLSKSHAEALMNWIEQNSVDQKKRDAVSVLNLIHQQASTQDPVQDTNQQYFVHTSQWQSAISEIEQDHRITHNAMNELRVIGPDYFKLLDEALYGLTADQRSANTVDVQRLTQLHQTPDALDECLSHRWLENTQASRLSQLTHNECDSILLKYLEQSGELEAFSKRASDKKNKLSTLNIPLVYDLSDIDLLQLADWYFAHYLELELPGQIENYAAKLGFDDMDAFYDMILQEYYYQEELKQDGT